jgi:hypothetical protein
MTAPPKREIKGAELKFYVTVDGQRFTVKAIVPLIKVHPSHTAEAIADAAAVTVAAAIVKPLEDALPARVGDDPRRQAVDVAAAVRERLGRYLIDRIEVVPPSSTWRPRREGQSAAATTPKP